MSPSVNKPLWTAVETMCPTISWACEKDNTEIIKLLLDTGNAHPEYQETKGGYSALILACYYNNIEIIKLLLDTGNAHPEYQDTDGKSALMWACKKDNTEIVKLFKTVYT